MLYIYYKNLCLSLFSINTGSRNIDTVYYVNKEACLYTASINNIHKQTSIFPFEICILNIETDVSERFHQINEVMYIYLSYGLYIAWDGIMSLHIVNSITTLVNTFLF